MQQVHAGADRIGGVARDEQNPQLRPMEPERLEEFPSAEPGHHDIGDKIDRTVPGTGQCQRLIAAPGPKHPVSSPAEPLRDQQPHLLLILGDENRAAANADTLLRVLCGNRRDNSPRCKTRKNRVKSCPSTSPAQM